jgi:hypothetical protein
MYLNFKLLSLSLLFCTLCFAQDKELVKKKKINPIAEIQLGYLMPKAYRNNFLSEALDLGGGYLVDFKLYLSPRFYFGLQKTYFEADVINRELVGVYNNSKISHRYAQAGISIFPVTSKFNILAGGGLGYAYYKNFQLNSKFSDDGFSLMGNVAVNYQFSKVAGLFSSVQLSKDFLSIAAAPEQDKFLNNATFSSISFGIQFQKK